MHRLQRIAAALAIPLLSTMAHADDGIAEVGIGGILLGKTDKIAMAREQLDVGCAQIHVSFDFVNESDSDVTQNLIFPLPAYPAFAPNENYLGAPANFTITVNGKPAPFHTQVRATVKGADVTSKLLAAGLSTQQIVRYPFDNDGQTGSKAKSDVTPKQSAALKQAGLLDTDNQATWDIHVSYLWQQSFPAHQTLHVEHTYEPFIAGGSDSGYYGPTEKYTDKRMREFCAGPSQKSRLQALFANKKSRDDFNGIPGTIIDYVLTTANTWKDGIRDFTLRIHTGSPEEVVATCFPGPFKKLPGNVFETHLTNFHPPGDLRVYVGNMRACAGNESNGEPPVVR